MTNSSRHNAQTWPYQRHEPYETLLRQSNSEWFAKRGYAVNGRMPYLLANWEDWPRNIILPEVAQFIQEERIRRSAANERFPLHKYIHHGLSSQAMLFNLVGPLIVRKDLSPLRHALSGSGITWPPEEVNPKFEVENREIFNEDSGQPTSIDLVIGGKDHQRSLFIEAKLVEREFGGCSVFDGGDCDGRNPVGNFGRCYLHHLGRRYWTLMVSHGFLDGPPVPAPSVRWRCITSFFERSFFQLNRAVILS